MPVLGTIYVSLDGTQAPFFCDYGLAKSANYYFIACVLTSVCYLGDNET